MRRWRRLSLILALGALAAAFAYVTRAPAADERPHPFNQDRNAVWLEHRWLVRPHQAGEMTDLFRRLDARGVRYLFPHVIPFDAGGRLPVHDREQMRAFLGTARSVAPELKLLPWVGGLRVGYRRTRPGTISLADLNQRQRIVAECRGLIDEGFDGVHLNIEPIDDGNVDFLALLRALRTAIGPDHLLSVSAIKPGPFAMPFAPNFLWTLDYYARVAASVDQVVVMAYDTALPNHGWYRRYVAYAARTLTKELAGPKTRARVLIGVPTYDETGFVHRGNVESVDNALFGVIAGLRGLGAGGAFEGVALYAEWTTDAQEWAVYERLWRGRPAGTGESGAP
jgi:hypothetical protein